MTDLERIQKILEAAGVNGVVTVNDESDTDVTIYSIDELVEVSVDNRSKLWAVGYWKEIPGSYWDPGDVDYVLVHETHSLIDAVQQAISNLVTIRTQDIGYSIFPIDDMQIDQE